MATEGIQRARRLQDAAKLSVNLMALGLRASVEDASDVRAALLRAVRALRVGRALPELHVQCECPITE